MLLIFLNVSSITFYFARCGSKDERATRKGKEVQKRINDACDDHKNIVEIIEDLKKIKYTFRIQRRAESFL